MTLKHLLIDSKLKNDFRTKNSQEYLKMIKKNKGKYKFTLHGLNIQKIRNVYGLEISNTLFENKKKISHNTTKLSELNTEKDTPEVISFLDETKRLHNCHVNMIDFKSGMSVNFLRYSCFCFGGS